MLHHDINTLYMPLHLNKSKQIIETHRCKHIKYWQKLKFNTELEAAEKKRTENNNTRDCMQNNKDLR